MFTSDIREGLKMVNQLELYKIRDKYETAAFIRYVVVFMVGSLMGIIGAMAWVFKLATLAAA